MAEKTKTRRTGASGGGSRRPASGAGTAAKGRNGAGGRSGAGNRRGAGAKSAGAKTGKSRAAAMERARLAREDREREIRLDIALVVLLVIMAFLFLSLLGFGGGVGHVLGELMFGLFGIGAWCLPVYFFLLSLVMIAKKGGPHLRTRVLSFLLLIFDIQTAGHLWLHAAGRLSLDPSFDLLHTFRFCADSHAGGGIIGGALAWASYHVFGQIFTWVLLAGIFAILLILVAQRSPVGAARGLWERRQEGRDEGGPGFWERRARAREERKKERARREEEALAREAERILASEEADARIGSGGGRKLAGETDGGPGMGGRLSSSRKRRRMNLDLEGMLVGGQTRHGAGRFSRSQALAGAGGGSIHGGSAGSGKGGYRRDVHEIRVMQDGGRAPLTIPSAKSRGMAGSDGLAADGAKGFWPDDRDPDRGQGPDPEGTRYRRAGVPGVEDLPYGEAGSGSGPEDGAYGDAGRDFAHAETAYGSSEGRAGHSEAVYGSSEGRPGQAEAADGVKREGSCTGAIPGIGQDGEKVHAGKSPGPGKKDESPRGDFQEAPRGGEISGAGLSGIAIHRDRGTDDGARSLPGRTAVRRSMRYVAPPFSLLTRGSGGRNEETERELKETALRLQETLRTFGVQVTITDISQGPSVTRYELMPDQGVKVSRIVNLSDDIKLRLAATDIRIEAPIPGKSAIGIEVPNKRETTVHLRELLESRDFRRFDGRLPFIVGKDIGGKAVIADIARMPHLLIAGATGSGKSVCINTIILSILYRTSPDKVRLLMIDPKVVELSVYKKIPHLIIPVVTDAKKASAALGWAVAEMEKRYKLFAAAGVRDLNGYNALAAAYRKKREAGDVAASPFGRSAQDIPDERGRRVPGEAGAAGFSPKPSARPGAAEGGPSAGMDGVPGRDPLPRLVIIVDELADLMMVAKSDVESAICRLAQLARAAGIHLIIATQRPSVDVITGLIKANMPSRIAFAVSSQVDSRTILDMAGAEKLIGKGDMLFYPQNYQKPARIQGAFVSDDEVTAVVDYIRAHNAPSGKEAGAGADADAEQAETLRQIEHIAENGLPGQDGADLKPDPGRDEYFVQAGRYIIEKNKASIGLLQRIFKIGFNRAARIMDQLAEAGVVGEESSTRARQILMTLPEFEQFLEEME